MKVENLLPEVYYKESRDFAYIGRLIELCLNYMKTGADCVGIGLNNPNIQSVMINLLINTLGFEARHTYLLQDIIYVASAFIEMLRNKGTPKAINMAIRLLLNAQGVENPLDIDFVTPDSTGIDIRIQVPDILNDVILLEDIFDYILPVGTRYTLTYFSADLYQYKTQAGVNDSSALWLFQAPNRTLSQIRGRSMSKGTSQKAENDKMNYVYGLGTIYTGVADATNIDNSELNQSYKDAGLLTQDDDQTTLILVDEGQNDVNQQSSNS